MKRLAALFLVLLVTTDASGASPEQRYFDLRDSYIKKFSSSGLNEPVNEESFKQHQAALDELTILLRTAVGPVTVKGLSAEAKSNVNTLDEHDSGFGHLDGLAFASSDYKTHVIVTTTALLQHWLAEHRKDGMPQDVGAALRSGDFYQSAEDDSAFAKYTDLPIAKPAGARLAVAALGVRSNADLKGTPNEIDVAVIQGERIFVATTRVELKLDPIPACERVWTRVMAKPINKTDPRGDIRRENEADAAFARCFAKVAPSLPLFAAAARTAQSLLELLPLR